MDHAGKSGSDGAAVAPFGQQLYEELRRLPGGNMVTSRLRYAGIQRLKAADREETVRLFHGSSYQLLQHIRSDSPAQLAALLVGEAVRTNQGVFLSLTFMGAVLGS